MLKNRWDWVVLLKLGGSGSFSIRNGLEGNVFVKKWVEVDYFSSKLGRNGSCLLKNG